MGHFKSATKKESKLRLALFGPSGSGKTFTSLRIASGIVHQTGGKIALIDSERRSASKYADRFTFDTVALNEKNIDEYVKFINEASGYNYSVLIIDSLTHAWKELLIEIDRLAKTKYKGNSWGAWSEGTPRQKYLVDALLNFNGHIIATMRSKTEWIVESNENKTSPKRVGTSPDQGKGIEYEFDLLFDLSPEHVGNVLKDRTGKFQDKVLEFPGEEFGAELINWLTDGEKLSDYTSKINNCETIANLKSLWYELNDEEKSLHQNQFSSKKALLES